MDIFHNVVACASLNRAKPTEARSILEYLLSIGADINSLDCVVGWGQRQHIAVYYCTALDLLKEQMFDDESRGEESPGYLSNAIRVLRELGGCILPRCVFISHTFSGY